MARIKKEEVKPVITPASKISKYIKFNGKGYALTFHMLLYTYPDFSFELIEKVTDENGKELEGVWWLL